ncbi:MAG: ribonuclease P protein subunit [Methanoregula sp.]|jgi:ribonuclease P protein subunit POP4|nr:ribonuclease P protein subunit [Methanoregula sp.]
MITSQNIIRHELIGLDVLVSGAANPLHRGLSGRIIDETKHMIAIQTVQGIKQVPKMHSRFRTRLPDGTFVEIDGSALTLAPEKRINLHEKKRIP